MIINYFISTIIINFIYYQNLSFFHQKKKINIFSKTFIIIVFTSAVSFTNVLEIPILNFTINLLSFSLISLLFFIHEEKKSFLLDFLIVIIIGLVDSIFYLLFHTFIPTQTSNFAETMLILTSSLALISTNYIFHKIFDLVTLKSAPTKELFTFLFFSLVHISILGIINHGISTYDYILKSIVLIISICFVFSDFLILSYLEHIVKKIKTENNVLLMKKQNELTNQYYQGLKEKNATQQQLIHDFYNQIQSITKAYKNNNPQLAENIIKEIKEEHINSTIISYSSSDILNIILYDKYEKAILNDIDFIIKISPVDLSFISDFEMITLFGNLLDNAIDASLKLNTNRMIELKVYAVNSMLSIIIKNNYDNSPLVHRKGKLISTKEHHDGFGITNIEKIIHRKNGFSQIKNKFGLFTYSIVIPIEEK